MSTSPGSLTHKDPSEGKFAQGSWRLRGTSHTNYSRPKIKVMEPSAPMTLKQNLNNYKLDVLGPASPEKLPSKSLKAQYRIGINSTESSVQLSKRKPFLSPP